MNKMGENYNRNHNIQCIMDAYACIPHNNIQLHVVKFSCFLCKIMSTKNYIFVAGIF